MAYRLIFNPAIPDDLEAALNHYEAISPTLANRFRSSVNEIFDEIASRPESFPMETAPIRFARVDRFPYLILFTIRPKFISLLAIVHGSSDPQKWRKQ